MPKIPFARTLNLKKFSGEGYLEAPFLKSCIRPQGFSRRSSGRCSNSTVLHHSTTTTVLSIHLLDFFFFFTRFWSESLSEEGCLSWNFCSLSICTSLYFLFLFFLPLYFLLDFAFLLFSFSVNSCSSLTTRVLTSTFGPGCVVLLVCLKETVTIMKKVTGQWQIKRLRIISL